MSNNYKGVNREVEFRYVTNVNAILAGVVANVTPTKFDKFINISFQPDEVIIRQIAYVSDHEVAQSFAIVTNLVNDPTFAIITDQTVAGTGLQAISCEIHHNITQPIQGEFTFSINTDVEIRPAPADSFVGMLLEFIRYKR